MSQCNFNPSTCQACGGCSCSCCNSKRASAGSVGPRGIPGARGARGETGPQGEVGPQGEAGADGEPGDAATIAVGTVSVGAAGSTPTVTNSGTDTDAVFDFQFPPSGAQSYGGLSSSLPQMLNTVALQDYQVVMNINMPAQNMTLSANTITVQNAGTYLVYYHVDYLVNPITAIQTGIRVNGTVSATTTTYADKVQLNVYAQMTWHSILKLNAGSVLDVFFHTNDVTAMIVGAGKAELVAVQIA